MKKVAILYDFDKTLCTKDMQEYSLLPNLGYDDSTKFWKEVTELSVRNSMDGISSYLYLLQKKFEDLNKPLKKEYFKEVGKSIELYKGVEEFFKRINEYGKTLGLEVEHYIISSGMAEIIESAPIANEFKKIYACRYYYDEDGIAKWPAQIVNYTTKTQYIFRINKQVLDESNNKELNAYTPHNDRPVPFNRMIYIADGITDVPCLKLVKEYGGKSIVVYNPNNAKAGMMAQNLLHENRADFVVSADYRENSDMDQLIKLILDYMGANVKLEELEGTVR